MICAYCQKESQPTREHVISESLIELFPECNFTFRQSDSTTIFEAHPVVKDVCANCNNKDLSKLDQYAVGLVKNYFYQEYHSEDRLMIEFDYDLLARFLLKTCYNSDRSVNVDTEWFAHTTNYILGKERSKKKFSVLGGLAINTSPLPLFFFDNKQLEVLKGGKLLAKSQLRYSDPFGREVQVDKNNEFLNIPDLHELYVIRMGAGQFIVILWKDEANEKQVQIYEQLIQRIYPYSLFGNNEREVIVGRCTHAFNYPFIHIIDTKLGMDIADSTNGSFEKSLKSRKDLGEDKWNEYVQELREDK